MRLGRCFWVLAAVVALLGTGCAHMTERKAERELEMVARRWCMTVRASQVIPIYPLNEDIQPGDVFVVDTPAQRQASDYNKRGYLDLEHLLVRLNPTNYTTFYERGYGINDGSVAPRLWQFPESSAWSNAPLAGFPSYTINVKRGGGLNAAFPVYGIPVGLSLLDSAQAKVSVQLSDAHSFGLDQATLETPFRQWLSSNADIIEQFTRPTNDHRTAYLRLVTRVFLVEAVNVTLTGDEASSFGASGGAPKKVVLEALEDSNTLANYTNAIATLNTMIEALGQNAPGGSIKLAGASSRSLSLNERFKRPLVIGYIAQDYPILPDGRLGNPVSTKDVLEGRIPDPLELSLAKLRLEQDQAKTVADQAVARVHRLTDEAFGKALNAGVANNILSESARARIAATGRKEGEKSFTEEIYRMARSADVRSRCDLHSFVDSLDKL